MPRGNVRRLSRRAALKLLGAAGLGLAIGCEQTTQPSIARRTRTAVGTSDWHDTDAWGGSIPGIGDTAVISGRVTLRSDAHVAGVVIEPGGHLIFMPNSSVTLESAGNVVVRGRLTMRPAHWRHVHRLLFPRVDESTFVGGGMDVLDSDVGLWVMGDGVLDLVGSTKMAWTRASGGVPAGATSVELQQDPLEWDVGDEIVITPTVGPRASDHFLAYDSAEVTAIEGRTVTLSRPTAHEHPVVSVGRGKVMTAEVLNLTRNVSIEGTTEGRTHVFIRSSRPQLVKHVLIRHAGPRQLDGERAATFVPGRYGIHFHHAEDGSRGSLVEGVVVRDAGSHCFVPHTSHGVTFRDCLAHNVIEGPFWWDVGDPTNDTRWENCVASLVRSDPSFRGYSLAGFLLGKGDGNVVRSCVAVGVQGSASASGFMWPAGPQAEGIWRFDRNIAHNNRVLGIYAWQNTPRVHVISRFIGYHNGRAGILHGSYRNPYRYENVILYANLGSELEVFALSGSLAADLVTFHNVLLDGNGLHDFEVTTGAHPLVADRPVRFVGCEFKGYLKAGFSLSPNPSAAPDWFRLEDCIYQGNEFWLHPEIHEDAMVEIEDDRHGSIVLRRFDQPGTFVPQWNASVTPEER